MNNQDLLERLAFHNPWWEKGQVPIVFTPPFKRFIFGKILSYLDLDRIVMLKGPRRTGKTTIMYQIIAQLLNNGINPRNILYLSFDDPLLKIPLEEILSAYEILKVSGLKDTASFIFLDEAQFFPDWELTVKLYFDRKYPLKFFVSGSSVSLLTQKTESLAGRSIEETIYPFSFAEMTLFNNPNSELEKLLKSIKGQLFVKNFPSAISPFINRLKLSLEKYFSFGGFPHILSAPPDLWTRLLTEDIVQKVIFRDLVERYNIRQPTSLERLFAYLGKNSSGIINVSTLSAGIELSRPITEQYLSYLEQSLLIFRIPKFSHSPKESLRSNPKAHLIDPSLANLYGANKDQLIETAVADHLFAKFGKNLLFWRDQNHEIDLIIRSKDLLIPVEVKNNHSQEIPNGILYFMQKENLQKGIVVYRGNFNIKHFQNMDIYFIPLYLFLLT
ncbi:hypothetical protein A3D78_04080 [Candidatus Gottesmanbacteria bacterium RIFCSPHIGHO2_02_FULL_39_14]|uniref:AAA+ ATPase domain-containing protein n=2 Tax=Candidatus Gottesmaniibacteriota TaxID=1752720 RepID=A0A1F5ZYC6_9BACT|nr:MAG: hypothetical protein A3D78_04080 [Candidatus Gottesmanbacteria bacterium RIFCSPHIGHO2_02_FULL_39_14]OGG31281.1 MAG: hypothetical protein A3I51_02360 [Candidatus Gottesmanbacteria bacterium RIFCSPLOWO2_02_FULL_38_8]